jgi:hypothetical protein
MQYVPPLTAARSSQAQVSAVPNFLRTSWDHVGWHLSGLAEIMGALGGCEEPKPRLGGFLRLSDPGGWEVRPRAASRPYDTEVTCTAPVYCQGKL